MESAQRLFHLFPGDVYDAWIASKAATFEPSSLVTEGFVHLSFAAQLAGTLETHFAGQEDLVLVEWRAGAGASALDPALVIEASRGGARFPHLYRPIARSELRHAWRLGRARAAWTLPILAAHPDEDEPSGIPLPPV